MAHHGPYVLAVALMRCERFASEALILSNFVENAGSECFKCTNRRGSRTDGFDVPYDVRFEMLSYQYLISRRR
jgi:hypothetical protein